MQKEQKEEVVTKLVERLRGSDTLLVADYRGLSMGEVDDLRARLRPHGARFSVVKNTLTRRAAREAGMPALLELLQGPTAIAFIEPSGDPVAVAKVLNDVAKTTRVLVVRGGVLGGGTITEEQVADLATLPPLDILRGQVLGAIVAPLTSLLGLVTAPLQNLYGLIDARIEQLGGAIASEEAAGGTTDEAAPAPQAAEPAGDAATPTTDESAPDAPTGAEAATAEGSSEVAEAEAPPDAGITDTEPVTETTEED